MAPHLRSAEMRATTTVLLRPHHTTLVPAWTPWSTSKFAYRFTSALNSA